MADAAKGAVLAALRAKGVTADELCGMAQALRAAATPLPGRPAGPLVDTCGTGGDGAGSINVSTATALAVAALGIPVVKHGNRSVSSRSGSADVLEAMGIGLPATARDAGDMLARCGFTFLFAPLFHPAMKAVAPVRRALGVRTVFNILGPLANPATPSHQLVGAYDPDAARLMARALAGLELERAFVVHGAPAWDEATPMGPFLLLDVTGGTVTERTVDPRDYGIPRCRPEDLAGGDPEKNARLLGDALGGSPGPRRDAVVLNTALVLQLLEPGRRPRPLDPREAAARAEAALESGAVAQLIARLREHSAAGADA